ncbi:MAG: NADH:ubiquinone reductase (Na(+)-transporting) subunit C [Bacteroidales bacterium]|jgi:Na+-transporting NADH:ubiquinone oxidoreductase subunit C|nr:NADH:ubiquinone reductase (Na(+)-transporting) subunit C [Bacteroidales bacterium]HOB77180.1 NADH:ubiquinone reductase (Na(+)-transporting) subunit C [Bacteroidales bacterium]HPZ61367.1 NADH:ubiquinone reductase (Na(+)-transporting) subunit C [Bacteroidales bacterium]HQD58433.1 NADH:ubiquinone reductase (Na(+)-transporting) subunit C [Bacteroidales bacterium]
MYKFTNKYIIIYSIIMVAIVAVLLTLGATALKPLQDKNKKNEKIGYILRASRQEFDPKNAEDTYKKLLIKEIAINESGDIIAEFDYINGLRGKLRPFDIDVNTETKKFKEGKSYILPIYLIQNNGDTLTVIPFYGMGLWGAIWGYVALENDLNTIHGAVFDHKGETPGLGAEISDLPFQNQFIGKKIFDENQNFVGVAIVKGGVRRSNIPELHGVDAISGGTFTSKGLDNMLLDGFKMAMPYIEKHRN